MQRSRLYGTGYYKDDKQLSYHIFFMRNVFLTVLLLALFSTSLSLSTYTEIFSTDDLINGNPTISHHQSVVFPLGNLVAGMTLSVTLNIPDYSGVYPLSSFILRLFQDINSYNVVSGFNTALCTGSPGATSSYCSFTFDLTQDDFYALRVRGVNPNVVQYMSIYVTYYNSSMPLSVGNNQMVVLSVTEIARRRVMKMIYLDSPTLYTASLFPYNSGEDKRLRLYNVTVSGSNSFPMGGPDLFGPVVPTFDNSVATYNLQLDPGYYILLVRFNNDPRSLVRLVFQGDPYACPFTPAFADYYSNFPGCVTSGSSTSAYPCNNFNQVLQRCQGCFDGFIFDNGKCLFNTSCPDRHWYNRGTCTLISADCQIFEYFTGVCTDCFDKQNYEIVGGNCVEKQVICGDRQWKQNSVCYNVSITCGLFNQTNGECTSCVDPVLYQLNFDGTCTLRVITCPQNTYKDGLECIPIPATCATFNDTLKTCVFCIRGYLPQNGVCVRYSCPDRQVPSPIEIACIDVSPECGDYDDITGECINCRRTGYLPQEGICKMVTSALAGCQAAQELGFGICVSPEQNCAIFDLRLNQCIDCFPGYQEDYRGKCVLNTVCGPFHFSQNNICIPYPPNCIGVDQDGRCNRCESELFTEIGGYCYMKDSCQVGYYRNSNGQCIQVSSDCATYNPSNGWCITCKILGTFPNSGVCCPTGTIFHLTGCISTGSLTQERLNPQSNRCLQFHPDGSRCLYCPFGTKVDPILPLNCISIYG